MRKINIVSIIGVIALLMGFAAIAKEAKLAEIYVDVHGVGVSSNSEHGLAVTIAGPEGFVLEKKIPAGESGFINSPAELADGYYNYEIRIVPNMAKADWVESKSRLNNGRSEYTKRAAITGSALQTGGFRVLNGAEVNPYLTEQVEQSAQ